MGYSYRRQKLKISPDIRTSHSPFGQPDHGALKSGELVPETALGLTRVSIGTAEGDSALEDICLDKFDSNRSISVILLYSPKYFIQ